MSHDTPDTARRGLIAASLGVAAMGAASTAVAAAPKPAASTSPTKDKTMTDHVTTKDGAKIYFKDWGAGQPIVFSHGWPLSSDDWEAQMMFFGAHGYRVIAHDRRGHGKSSQTWEGHDMDTYADDLHAVITALDLKKAIHIGHSTGGGEVARYLGRHGTSRAAGAVLIGAVPPVMVKKDSNPEGLPLEVFDGFRSAVIADRAQLYRDVPTGPFYGFNRPGAKVSQGLIDRWWAQGMSGSPKAHYDCIKAFSETDFTEDLKKIDVPVLILHGEDDQIVPYKDAALKAIKLVKHGTLKTYPGLPHGMASTHHDIINNDILAWLKA
jgi:non-heme chloroperoxidase